MLSGVGRFQTKGQPAVEIKAGDTIWIPPGENHWHGAGPETAMVHIAIQETDGEKHIEWLDHVSDEEYGSTS